jgi:soluble lytic murein transglycosylase
MPAPPSAAPWIEEESDEIETPTTAEDLLELKPRVRAPGPATDAAIPPAKPYAEAKRLLARGHAALALKALKPSPTDSLLEDREALLRGDALLALGDTKGAKEEYLKALESAEVRAVKAAAARGLAGVYGALGDYPEKLKYLDALLSAPNIAHRPEMMLDRALVLKQLNKKDEASKTAWRVLLEFPASHAAAEAEKMLGRLNKEGVARPLANARLELARIGALWRSGEFARAESELDKLAQSESGMRKRLELERAAIMKARGKATEEYAILEKLYKEGLDDKAGPAVLERLGQLAMNGGDSGAAITYFDQLAERFPKSRRAAEAQYLAAWLPYNTGDFEKAVTKFLAFAHRFPHNKRRPEALWFAGWSAYSAKRDALARRAFDQLLEEHPNNEMCLFARYWTARIRERNGDLDGAREAYRDVLRAAPLSYHGHWASNHLQKLGERVILTAPADDKRATVSEVLALLGPKRPIGIDRAIALHKAGLEVEAQEELDTASASLAKVKDTRGRVMIAEMLESLGAHHQAFRIAVGITLDGGDLITGRPYAWRAWRLAYPKAFWGEVQDAAESVGIDPLLVLAIMRTESSFRPGAQSLVGARGLMQLMPDTARRIGKVDKRARPYAARFTEPRSNIWLGAWYLKNLLDRYGGRVALAAGAYNAGPGAMDRWVTERSDRAGKELDAFVENIPYRETRTYVRHVLEAYLIYRRLDAQPDLDLAWAIDGAQPIEGTVAF